MKRAPVAVLCAMEAELAHLRAGLPPAREDWHWGRVAWVTALDRQPIVLAICGIGMVSAAATTEAIVARYSPAAILNCGCAGAHRRDLLPGDVVVGERLVAYDHIQEEPDGGVRFAGMWYLCGGTQQKVDFLPADEHLLDLARRVAAGGDWRHEPWPAGAGWPDGLPHRAPRLIFGTIASSDRWNRARASIEAIVARHGSHCEDMEATAIALICATHAVPFLAVKDVVNNELLSPTSGADLDVEIGAAQLGRRAAAFDLAVLRAFAAPESSLPGPDRGGDAGAAAAEAVV